MSETKRVRCAIYTRKSSEEGLDQSFNSLHAQREACEAYILSQKHEGWEVISTEYDDGGFSGGNMERPGLRKLLADIAAKRIDTVVVYKVDRLTRSLADFAKIVEQFDGQGVSFVSVTQQFNTTSSMGRLTLNVLLSFAQFEREVTGERIRDKIAASKRKGMWMGGAIPLGYDLRDRSLVVNEPEADKVRTIYQLYLKAYCVSKLQEHLEAAGIRSKKRLSQTGRVTGDAAFSRGALYALLQNPLYIGETRHKDKTYPGQHAAIIDKDVWERVQQQLLRNGVKKGPRPDGVQPHLLIGLLFDADGRHFTPSHTTKNGRRYRYYVSQALQRRSSKGRPGRLRLPAKEIESIVLDELGRLMRSPQRLAAIVSGLNTNADELAMLAKVAESKEASYIESGVLLKCISRVVVQTDSILISVLRDELRSVVGLQTEDSDSTVDLVCEARLRKVGGEIRFELPPDAGTVTRQVPSLTKAVAMARGWLDSILSGEAANQRDLARQTGYDERYISRHLPLAFLAPDITEEILDGRQPPQWCLDTLVGKITLCWSEQRRSHALIVIG